MEKRYIMYVLIIIVCIIALGIGVYAQVFYKNADTDKLMVGATSNQTQITQVNQTEEKIKTEFNNIFTNTLNYVNKNLNNYATRKDMSKDLVYTINQVAKTEKGKYEMNINIPTVNIVSENAEKINDEIEKIFLAKATSILTTNGGPYTIYNIDYASYVNNNILSLAIRATLKEGDNPQRVMFMTYNYNLEDGSIITLNDLLQAKGLTTATVQNKITKEIKEISKKTEDLKNIGYTVYSRNTEDSMYKLENTKTYFLGANSYLYILYPYGNTNNTSEVDIILF